MDIDNKTKIIFEKTKDFYKRFSADFSGTRTRPLKSWDRIVQLLNEESISESLKVCDLGCGNGIFYPYFKKHYEGEFSYLGLDITQDFIEEASSKYPDANFRIMDIFTGLDQLNEKFDFIAGFGITHHIPPEFIKKWIRTISEKLEPNGFLALCYWQTKKLDQDTGSFIGWKEHKDQRYAHVYGEKSIREIYKELPDLKLRDLYSEDQQICTILQKAS